MKPLVMGIIGGVIGSVVVIGGLFGYLAYEQSEYENALAIEQKEYEKFYLDYLIVQEYYDEINEMYIDQCQREPRLRIPSSLSDGILQQQAYEKFFEGYKNFLELRTPVIKELLEKAIPIQEKYSGTKYYEEFNYIQYECEISKANEEFAQEFNEYFNGNSNEIEKLALKLQGDCVVKAQNPLEQNKCYAQIEEFRDLAKLIRG